MEYKGSCHCGKVKFKAEGEINQVIECNCTHCSRKGFLLWFVPRTQFELLTPESNLKEYLFNKHVIHHMFCPECGVECFGFAKDPSGVETVAINVRCLENIDLSSLKRKEYDGLSK